MTQNQQANTALETSTERASSTSHSSWGARVGKQVAGSAIATAAGAGVGAAYGVVKGGRMATAATIGGFVGLMSSIGLGAVLYDSVLKRPTHINQLGDRLDRSR